MNVIFGAIAAYLVIAFLGALICFNLELNFSGSFSIPGYLDDEDYDTFLYYSFVTMSSLGTGDITPVSHSARVVSMFLVIFGQLYPMIIVAVLVGKYIIQSAEEEIVEEVEKEVERDLKKRET